MIGFISAYVLFRPPSIEDHWKAVEDYKAYMEDPSNYLPVEGTEYTHAEEPFDPLPHLAALVEADELEYLDIVLPEVPRGRKPTLLWRSFCQSNQEHVVFSDADPSSVHVKADGTQPFHVQFWYKEPGEELIQNLIREIEYTNKRPEKYYGGLMNYESKWKETGERNLKKPGWDKILHTPPHK